MRDPSHARNVADRAMTRTTLLIFWNVVLTAVLAADLLIGKW
jgi:hypothetical protein